MFGSDRWAAEFFYQASGSATNFMGGNLFKQINVIEEQYELEVDDQIEAAIGHLCVSREGKKYAFIQTIGQGLVHIASRFNIKLKNPFANGDSETNCIEEQFQLLFQGFNSGLKIDIENIDIKTYRDFILGLPGVRRVK